MVIPCKTLKPGYRRWRSGSHCLIDILSRVEEGEPHVDYPALFELIDILPCTLKLVYSSLVQFNLLFPELLLMLEVLFLGFLKILLGRLLHFLRCFDHTRGIV